MLICWWVSFSPPGQVSAHHPTIPTRPAGRKSATSSDGNDDDNDDAKDRIINVQLVRSEVSAPQIAACPPEPSLGRLLLTKMMTMVIEMMMTMVILLTILSTPIGIFLLRMMTLMVMRETFALTKRMMMMMKTMTWMMLMMCSAVCSDVSQTLA